MPGSDLPTQETQILDNLVRDFQLSPDLIDRLLDLVSTKHPSLEIWGAKAALRRDIAEAIEKAVLAQETLDSNDDI